MTNYAGYSARAFAELEAQMAAEIPALNERPRCSNTLAMCEAAEPVLPDPILGRDGQLHRVDHGAAIDQNGTFEWDCVCGEGGAFIATPQQAALSASEHLAAVEILAEEV